MSACAFSIAARAASHSTAEGARFLERCRRIFAEIEAAELELSQTHETPRGTLRAALPLAGALMMPALAAFSTRPVTAPGWVS